MRPRQVLECKEGRISDVQDVLDDVPPGQGEVGQLDVERGAGCSLRLLPPMKHLNHTNYFRPQVFVNLIYILCRF